MLILCLDGILGNGVEQACAHNADGRFQTEGEVLGLRIGVEGINVNGEFRIDEFVLLAVGELQGQSALHRHDRQPRQMNTALVNRWQEG